MAKSNKRTVEEEAGWAPDEPEVAEVASDATAPHGAATMPLDHHGGADKDAHDHDDHHDRCRKNFEQAVERIAAAITKLTAAGMGGTDAGGMAVEIFRFTYRG